MTFKTVAMMMMFCVVAMVQTFNEATRVVTRFVIVKWMRLFDDNDQNQIYGDNGVDVLIGGKGNNISINRFLVIFSLIDIAIVGHDYLNGGNDRDLAIGGRDNDEVVSNRRKQVL
jgi:Ca2+-binding RTX toxin-like protein